MASNVDSERDRSRFEEFVLIADALEFIEARSGFSFERRQFIRYCESGLVQIDGKTLELVTLKVGERWFVARRSIEAIVTLITAASRA
jgi:hypothetical protein